MLLTVLVSLEWTTISICTCTWMDIQYMDIIHICIAILIWVLSHKVDILRHLYVDILKRSSVVWHSQIVIFRGSSWGGHAQMLTHIWMFSFELSEMAKLTSNWCCQTVNLHGHSQMDYFQMLLMFLQMQMLLSKLLISVDASSVASSITVDAWTSYFYGLA